MGVNLLLARDQGADQRPPQCQFRTKSPTRQSDQNAAQNGSSCAAHRVGRPSLVAVH